MDNNHALTRYESKELRSIEEWKKKKPSVITNVANIVFKPVTRLMNLIIPQKVIEGTLIACNGMAQLLTDKKDILRDGHVEHIEDLRGKNLELSDALARKVHKWANGFAFVEGGAAGATGMAGMIADIPALITMSFRVVHKIGLCYGYECKTEADRQFVMGIISAAGSNTMQEKINSLKMLQKINALIAANSWETLTEMALGNKVGEEAAMTLIRSVAKKLDINLTKRKATQAIPVIGAGVGATMNLAFIDDVAWAARRCFQERWINDNQRLSAEKE